MVSIDNVPEAPLRSGKVPGIAASKEWFLAPDGVQYRYFWCEDWRRTPSNEEGAGALMAVVNDDTAYIAIPKEQVAGFARCDTPPKHLPGGISCYIVKAA